MAKQASPTKAAASCREGAALACKVKSKLVHAVAKTKEGFANVYHRTSLRFIRRPRSVRLPRR